MSIGARLGGLVVVGDDTQHGVTAEILRLIPPQGFSFKFTGGLRVGVGCHLFREVNGLLRAVGAGASHDLPKPKTFSAEGCCATQRKMQTEKPESA